MQDNPIWKMRFEGLKRYAHANQWGRESVRQWAEEGLMDDAPDVVALLEQWPLRYKDLEPGAWPAALLPDNPGWARVTPPAPPARRPGACFRPCRT